jgi:hypothetical protein
MKWKKVKKAFKRRPREDKRRTFGFMCAPIVFYMVKSLAQRCGVPYYCMAEHMLEMGISHINFVLSLSEGKELLEQHLQQHHLLVPAPTPDDGYDQKQEIIAKIQHPFHEPLDTTAFLTDIAKSQGLTLAEYYAKNGFYDSIAEAFHQEQRKLNARIKKQGN